MCLVFRLSLTKKMQKSQKSIRLFWLGSFHILMRMEEAKVSFFPSTETNFQASKVQSAELKLIIMFTESGLCCKVKKLLSFGDNINFASQNQAYVISPKA